MPHEFTPGPWHTGLRRAAGRIEVKDLDGKLVAMTNGWPESAANAQLIAQAPRLLKHLEKAYAALVAFHRSPAPPGNLRDEEMDAMQRAIGDAGGSTE